MANAPTNLKAAAVDDERDVSPRAAAQEPSGKRVRAIPFQGGTEIVIRREDFEEHGIDHDDVTWEKFKNDFTVPVGKSLSQKAADFLTENYKGQFEYVG